MKINLQIVIYMLCAANLFAQTNKKFSSLTQSYINFKAINPHKLPEGFVYKRSINGDILLSAMIKVDKDINSDELTSLGIKIGTKAGNIWTLRVPESEVVSLIKMKGVLFVQLDTPLSFNLDEVRKQTRADSVQKGINLPQTYTGRNVVIGVMDIGFDYTHPTLFDTSGIKYRVKRVWEQKSIGTPPAGFNYGNEITDTLQMWSKGTDNNAQSHGSHVVGIAAGSGYGSSTANSKYRGLAYSSDIVLIGITPPQNQWENTGMADIIDGINYIFSYAQSVGKPAVANLSWGCTIGPHDGTSLFSQACDNLCGDGKIFVCSAGNTGDTKLHINKTFTANDTTISTVATFQSGMSPKKTWVDIWGDTSKTFCVKITLYNGSTPGNTTNLVCIDDNVHNFALKGSNNDTCFVSLSTSSLEFNNRSHVLINLYSKVNDKIVITINGKEGTINMWNGYVLNSVGYYGDFNNGGFGWATTGNTNSTISDMASTKSVIAVGAYASKISFTNVSGSTLSYSSYVSKGNITPFSSRGPTIDNRIKPDITAPGMTIASSVNSFDASFKSAGSNYIYVVQNYYFPKNSKTYSYGMMSGTSMSSPSASGVIALMLEADNNLNPQRIKDVFSKTSIKDSYTGSIPSGGNNTWGFGKINAYGAIQNILKTVNIQSATSHLSECRIFPNPGNGEFFIEFVSSYDENAEIEIINTLGQITKKIHNTIFTGKNIVELDLNELTPGLYFTKIKTAKGTSLLKTIVQ